MNIRMLLVCGVFRHVEWVVAFLSYIHHYIDSSAAGLMNWVELAHPLDWSNRTVCFLRWNDSWAASDFWHYIT